MLRSTDTAEIERKLAGEPYGPNERADPVFLLKHMEQVSYEGMWWFAQQDGAIPESQVPDDWRHWKNVYLWATLAPWDRRAVEDGRAIVSWPIGGDGWLGRERSVDDYVGLYTLRPARKWRDLVERIDFDDEICGADEMAGFLEANSEDIVATAREIESHPDVMIRAYITSDDTEDVPSNNCGS